MSELELLKEIERLANKASEDILVCRYLKEEDWDLLSSWWKWWRWSSNNDKDFFPDNGTCGIMIEKNGTPIVAGFIYYTNSKVALLEWIISNPRYKQSDRKQAIELLITEAEQIVKEKGYKYMFSTVRNKHLINTHEKLGWTVDKNPSHEITKKL